jgi:hypothetical protein
MISVRYLRHRASLYYKYIDGVIFSSRIPAMTTFCASHCIIPLEVERFADPHRQVPPHLVCTSILSRCFWCSQAILCDKFAKTQEGKVGVDSLRPMMPVSGSWAALVFECDISAQCSSGFGRRMTFIPMDRGNTRPIDYYFHSTALITEIIKEQQCQLW